MKKISLLIVFVALASFTFSQGFISSKKSRCKKGLVKFLEENNYQSPIKETDSTLELHVRDTSVRPFDIVLTFNNKDRCIREFRKVDCDSCFDKWLNSALTHKYIKWRKIGDHTWVSQQHMKRKMTANPAAYSILITRETWTRKEYEELIGKK